jgi:hypothetical protein
MVMICPSDPAFANSDLSAPLHLENETDLENLNHQLAAVHELEIIYIVVADSWFLSC